MSLHNDGADAELAKQASVGFSDASIGFCAVSKEQILLYGDRELNNSSAPEPRCVSRHEAQGASALADSEEQKEFAGATEVNETTDGSATIPRQADGPQHQLNISRNESVANILEQVIKRLETLKNKESKLD